MNGTSDITITSSTGGGANDDTGAGATVLEVVETIESCVFVSVGVVGLIGAIIVVLVYTFRHNPTPSELIITALSVVDLLYNIFNNINNIVEEQLKTDGQKKLFASFSAAAFAFTLVSSFLLIATISINRWFAICRPLTYLISFSKTRVRNAMIVIFALSLAQGGLCFSYAYIENKTVQEVIDFENYAVINILVFSVVGIMLYSYINIIKTLRLQEQRLNKQSNRKKQELMIAYTKPREECGAAEGATPNGTKVAEINVDPEISAEVQLCAAAVVAAEDGEEIGDAIANGAEVETQPTQEPLKKQPGQAEQHEEESGKKQRKYFPLLSKRQKRQNSRDGDESQTAKDPKNKVTITLFIISCCFIIFVTPFLIFEDVAFFLQIDVHQTSTRIVRKILRILFLINFVNNPFIYFTTSEMFRHRLVNICQILIPKRFQPQSLRNDDQHRAQTQHVTRRTSAYATRL